MLHQITISIFSRQEEFQHAENITVEEYTTIRQWMEARAGGAGGGAGRGDGCAAAAWRSAWRECAGDARALCERLRLVLEPTARSRRAGRLIIIYTTAAQK